MDAAGIQSLSPSGARVQGATLAAPGSEWEFQSPVWLLSPGLQAFWAAGRIQGGLEHEAPFKKHEKWAI